MYTQKIAGAGKYRGLVHYHPVLYPVAKVISTNSGKVCKPIYNFAVCPAAFYFQCLWQVPVVNGYPGFNPLFKAIINNAVIMSYAGFINIASAGGKNSCPR